MTDDHGPCEIMPPTYRCPYCGLPPEPHSRYHEGPADCEAARQRLASEQLCATLQRERLEREATVQRDENGFRKAGAAFECVSSATHAGVISHQHQHLADEVARLTAENERLKQAADDDSEWGGAITSVPAKVVARYLAVKPEEYEKLKSENERLTRELRHAVANKEHVEAAANELLRMKDEEIARLTAALNQIASWEEGPVVTPSFDSPGAAETAREALRKDPCTPSSPAS